AFLSIAVRSGFLALKFPAALGLVAVFAHNVVELNMREHPIPLAMMAVLAWAEATPEDANGVKNQGGRGRSRVRDEALAEASNPEPAAGEAPEQVAADVERLNADRQQGDG